MLLFQDICLIEKEENVSVQQYLHLSSWQLHQQTIPKCQYGFGLGCQLEGGNRPKNWSWIFAHPKGQRWTQIETSFPNISCRFPMKHGMTSQKNRKTQATSGAQVYLSKFKWLDRTCWRLNLNYLPLVMGCGNKELKRSVAWPCVVVFMFLSFVTLNISLCCPNVC